MEDSELWNHLTQPKTDNSVSEAVNNIENDDMNESADRFHDHDQLLEANTDHPLDTCIQVSDIALDVSKAISISPAFSIGRYHLCRCFLITNPNIHLFSFLSDHNIGIQIKCVPVLAGSIVQVMFKDDGALMFVPQHDIQLVI
ncbi:hypothetical protein DPMN_073618 [Dreissena polymorpha]|uniref:Uncharacterized protein n=1 Tax=Dreissena polymorpha TaxID=45954 RepID=A0A9D4HDI6_DREPO|nr:hypothetical protein DPMN_073618 [Dreissena polymorpha]